jgi:hypothetical protein
LEGTDCVWSKFQRIYGKIIDYGSRIRINYFLACPIILTSALRTSSVMSCVEKNAGTISGGYLNGDFSAGSLNRLAELNFGFRECRDRFGKIRQELLLTFSKFFIKESGEVTISSTSSRY